MEQPWRVTDRRGSKGRLAKGRLAKGRLAKGRKQHGLNHNETYRTPIFCTVPLPKVPLVHSKPTPVSGTRPYQKSELIQPTPPPKRQSNDHRDF